MGSALSMTTLPPLPQPEMSRGVAAKNAVNSVNRDLRNQSTLKGRRQRASVKRLRVWLFAVVETEVTVLIVAAEVCAELLDRVTLEGNSEHVVYWPGLIGVQFKTTVPV